MLINTYLNTFCGNNILNGLPQVSIIFKIKMHCQKCREINKHYLIHAWNLQNLRPKIGQQYKYQLREEEIFEMYYTSRITIGNDFPHFIAILFVISKTNSYFLQNTLYLFFRFFLLTYLSVLLHWQLCACVCVCVCSCAWGDPRKVPGCLPIILCLLPLSQGLLQNL